MTELLQGVGFVLLLANGVFVVRCLWKLFELCERGR